MSTIAAVPETRGLPGRTAAETMTQAGSGQLARDAVARFRWSDGFSHARAAAFQATMTLLPASIVLVAVSALTGWGTLADGMVQSAESIAPGIVGEQFRSAIAQGAENGASHDLAAVALGAIAMIVAGATLFGQLERTANRIYGVEIDRPSVQKYTFGGLLLVSAGSLTAVFLALIGLGQGWDTSSSSGAHWWWAVLRWPLAAVVLFGAVLMVYRWSPHRRQPELRWLVPGAAVATAGILLVSLLLGGYLATSTSFGDTYGPFAGLIGILLWTYASCIAFTAGLALAAQLESARAGAPTVRSEEKIDAGEPDILTLPYGTALAAGAPVPQEDHHVEHQERA